MRHTNRRYVPAPTQTFVQASPPPRVFEWSGPGYSFIVRADIQADEIAMLRELFAIACTVMERSAAKNAAAKASPPPAPTGEKEEEGT